MPITITDIVARDIRFPTSLEADGSDAMNRARLLGRLRRAAHRPPGRASPGTA